jgi:hypothetical protein
MISLAEVIDVLSSTTYKPGWGFAAYETSEGIYVAIHTTAAHADNPQETIDLCIRSYLSPNDLWNRPCFLRWLRWRIERIELHSRVSKD